MIIPTNEITALIDSAQQLKQSKITLKIELTIEEAEFLNGIFGTVNEIIQKEIGTTQNRKLECINKLSTIEDNQKKIYLLALKALRLTRKNDNNIENSCSEIAKSYLVDFRTLFHVVQRVEKQRQHKLEKLKNLHIRNLYAGGMSKKELTILFSISLYKLNKLPQEIEHA